MGSHEGLSERSDEGPHIAVGPDGGSRGFSLHAATRVFQFELTVCDRCGGKVKIVAAVTDPRSIRTYLEGVGLPARAPPIAPARPHPQHEFDMDYAASAA